MVIKIGTVISGHIVYGIHANSYCIASPIVQNGNYVVWHIDDNGNGVWGGSYFPNQMKAEQAYAAKCFPWLEGKINIATGEDESKLSKRYFSSDDERNKIKKAMREVQEVKIFIRHHGEA